MPLYTGIAQDLQRRLEQHNAGTASRYTRSRLPVELVYHEGPTTKSKAMKRELVIKAMSRKAFRPVHPYTLFKFLD